MKDLSVRVKKLWPMLKFFDGQKYERLICKSKKVMANVKVFLRTDRRTDGQSDYYRAPA